MANEIQPARASKMVGNQRTRILSNSSSGKSVNRLAGLQRRTLLKNDMESEMQFPCETREQIVDRN